MSTLRPEAITFKQLRALRAVAEHGTLTAAAESIHLTTPAVHTQLRQLEENFGARLVDRGPQGVARLTLQGEAALVGARAIETALEACVDHVRALNDGMEGMVTLGVVATAKYFAPRLVAELHRAFAEIDVILRVGSREMVVSALQAASVDIAIMGRPPRLPAVHATVLGPHPHVLIAPPDHPLAGQGRIAAERVLAETFLAREAESGTRVLMERFIERLGKGRPQRVVELESNETIKQAVMAGLGVALISRHTVAGELAAGRLVELDAPSLPLVRQWFLVHRSDTALSAAGRRIHGYIVGRQGAFLPR
ncbi:LysR family transcriptional regulator [Rhodovulum sulfidophilum]|uniref:HTH-type transcriptional regulator CbbR n=3 Tax=Rhodovulum sulfidophilum TaxID=35806 RepID=A0ABS1RWG7_RHOSU|nr:LysR family transcriptional regulator [Rhodovulum sulfidophilum]MBL3561883.1 LysR family transcriptional regulator [Rhodovulum sulfidophilum]MBL3610227.1 LysR family transcriptional regulator [Rhodovulum sulfidophilum]MCE8420926.1 LysR family transcriptional regulator [Rhodovulum sulfidophilum]MCE8441187.1 LysR family transcriptional regulator [Rhodovulum sulfidophilum]MCE8470284.1 LysR family transcriptional regulator [Rhodovulum sulfidophilum]